MISNTLIWACTTSEYLTDGVFFSIGRLLCEKHSLAIDVLLLRIEAFLINKSLEVLTLESFGKFEQEIHFESAKVSWSSANLIGVLKKLFWMCLILLPFSQGSLNTKQLSNNRAPAARPPLPRTLTSMVSEGALSSCHKIWRRRGHLFNLQLVPIISFVFS